MHFSERTCKQVCSRHSLRCHRAQHSQHLSASIGNLTQWDITWLTSSHRTLNQYSWMKICVFIFKFRWNVFPRVWLTVRRHWFSNGLAPYKLMSIPYILRSPGETIPLYLPAIVVVSNKICTHVYLHLMRQNVPINCCVVMHDVWSYESWIHEFSSHWLSLCIFVRFAIENDTAKHVLMNYPGCCYLTLS